MANSPQRPFVYINMAATVDGKITSTGREYPRFTSPVDRVRMDRLRATADALMVGAGTVRSDNPTWHVRTPALRERSAPHRVLVSASAQIPDDSRFFDTRHGGRSILVTTCRTPEARLEAFEGRAEVWRFGEEQVDLGEALRALSATGVRRMLVEGGAELNWTLFELDLVDELYVTVAPSLLGGSEAPTLLGGSGWSMNAQRRLSLLEMDREGDEIYLRYAVRA